MANPPTTRSATRRSQQAASTPSTSNNGANSTSAPSASRDTGTPQAIYSPSPQASRGSQRHSYLKQSPMEINYSFVFLEAFGDVKIRDISFGVSASPQSTIQALKKMVAAEVEANFAYQADIKYLDIYVPETTKPMLCEDAVRPNSEDADEDAFVRRLFETFGFTLVPKATSLSKYTTNPDHIQFGVKAPRRHSEEAGDVDQSASEPLPSVSAQSTDPSTSLWATGPSLMQLRRRIDTTTRLAPSQGAKTLNYYYLQKSATSVIYDGRRIDHGPSRTTTPIDIYHPVFLRFHELCESDSLDIHPEDLKVLLALSTHCLTLGPTKEPEKNEQLRRLLQNFFGGDVRSVPNKDRTIPDANIWFKVKDGKAVGLILERKPEHADCDPYKQAVLSVVRAYQEMSTESFPILESSCIPCFLLISAGPCWTISGCIYTDKVVVQTLTPTFWFGQTHLDDDDTLIDAFRYFTALKGSLIFLSEYYQGFQPHRLLEPFLPHPRTYPDPNGSSVDFTYLRYLQTPDDCQTFLAEEDKGKRKIVVKFVARYCEEAHRLAASAGFAPELLYFGPLPGDGRPVKKIKAPAIAGMQGRRRMMVVMAYIEGKHQIPDDKTGFRKQVAHMLEILHLAGYVFGDLRLPNVIVTDSSAFLIDFNWSGPYDKREEKALIPPVPDKLRQIILDQDCKPIPATLYPPTKDGFTRYPLGISRSIQWAQGAKDFGLIFPSHDWEMLDCLFLPPRLTLDASSTI